MRVIEEVHPTSAHFQAVVHWRMEGPTPHLTHYNILNTSTSDINAMRCTDVTTILHWTTLLPVDECYNVDIVVGDNLHTDTTIHLEAGLC